MNQRNFTYLIIASSPLYTNVSQDAYDEVWDEYCRYKRMVPCCGGILVNKTGDKVGPRLLNGRYQAF
jgi:mRNA-decapping enzyme subunit 2